MEFRRSCLERKWGTWQNSVPTTGDTKLQSIIVRHPVSLSKSNIFIMLNWICHVDYISQGMEVAIRKRNLAKSPPNNTLWAASLIAQEILMAERAEATLHESLSSLQPLALGRIKECFWVKGKMRKSHLHVSLTIHMIEPNVLNNSNYKYKKRSFFTSHYIIANSY